jgi:uncharacterized SAM-binding protein YcdF (DUF218 family)
LPSTTNTTSIGGGTPANPRAATETNESRNRSAAPARSRHQPSGTDPTTLAASTTNNRGRSVGRVIAGVSHQSRMSMNDLSKQDRADIATLWDYHVLDSGDVTADFLIALGSHDVRVAEHAAQVYHAGAAPLVIVAGGSGKITSGEWTVSEAERYVERMVELGVPDACILREEKSTNTGENFSFVRNIVEDLRLPFTSGIVVCKPYMARRALATAHRRWEGITWYTRTPRIALWSYPTDDVPLERMINLMVGDLQRMDVYAAKGFQVPVEIPDVVWAAYRRLVDRGFDEFVISEP